MTNSKTTKRALFSSVVALLLCFTMLLGTTYAWFTDSAVSGSNVITSGNLDIVVEYTLDGENWDNLDGATDLFQKGLWEPGHTEVVALRIKNNGTLALKYAANMNIVSETTGKTKDGADIVLSDILTVSTLLVGTDDRELFPGMGTATDMTIAKAFEGDDVLHYETTSSFKTGNVLRNDCDLAPGDTEYIFVKVDMAETVGNEANHDGTHVPTINFGINVLATQFTYENDSFGSDYDKDATYPELADVWDGTADTSWYNNTDKTFTLSTAEELAGLSVLSANGNTFSGKTIVLDSGMDLDGKQWTPIKQFSGTFDGGEHTISNFVLDGTSGRAGFIQNLGQYPATVKNLTLSEVNGIAGSNQYFGIVAANGHTSILENVHVVDCKIETTNKDAWVGGVYGYFNWTSASNCTVENLKIDATDGARFVGGFSGNMDQDLTISNVDIIDLKITIDATNGACQVGGFTGQTQTGHRQPTFTNCDVIGLDIVAKGEVQLGGFVGDAGAHTIANNCTVEGKIDASGVTDDRSFIGGFLADSGWNNNESNKGGHKLTNCSADVDIITGGSTAGGFIGSTTAYHPNDDSNRNMPITMTNCTATGTVTVAQGASATVGGFAGEAERGTFKNCSTTSETFIGKIWDGYTLSDDGAGKLTVTKN